MEHARKALEQLASIPMHDSQAIIQGSTEVAKYVLETSDNPMRYRDQAAYDAALQTAAAKSPGSRPANFAAIGELEGVVEVGEQQICFLYTYRSMFAALGLAKPADDSKKGEFWMTVCETM